MYNSVPVGQRLVAETIRGRAAVGGNVQLGRRPIFFATLIIITAYFPLFTLQRGEAALFTPMAYTVGVALFGALICTLALIPGLAYLAFRKPRPVQ
jgi:cobalt-zinc-cadmium resistance protein CzcA